MNRWDHITTLINRLPYPRVFVVLGHLVLVTFAYWSAFFVRFNFHMPTEEWIRFLYTLPILLAIRLGFLGFFHLYEGLWRYVSMEDLLAILRAMTFSSLIFLTVVLFFFGYGFPRSVFLLDWVFCIMMVGGVRLAIRAFREESILTQRDRRDGAKKTLIVGAGDAGEMLYREIFRNHTLDYKVVGFVDDDQRKQQLRIHGISVIGTINQLPELCQSHDVQEILIAIPSATPEQMKRAQQLSRESGVSHKTIPDLQELLKGKARIGQLQEVKPEDLLEREEVYLDLDKLYSEFQGKRILISGAGGSIGSELCRQVASFHPEMLLLYDQAESNLFFVDHDLKLKFKNVQVIPVVGDILNKRKVQDVIQEYTPHIIYHAAAYKHVLLMEKNPLEAIRNNVFGTELLALAAREGCVKKFILISTDKAIKPVGIMGMTKRVAENILLTLDSSLTTYVAVRFGNVLGSDGSVLPLFKWQMSRGGPLTVTDPEASRYFMLISEAARLVIQAGSIGKGGEIFFLDMGESVQIKDLAENLIRLSGLEPNRDIPIEVVGLRSGERLHEQIISEQDELVKSDHEKVFIVRNSQFDARKFQQDLRNLRGYVEKGDKEEAVQQLRMMTIDHDN